MESTGATHVASGDGFAAQVRDVVPEGVDLVVDLVGGQTLREAARLATDLAPVMSAADPAVTELGGATRQRDPEAMEKMTSVIQYGLVDPHVTGSYPLEQAREALAEVESGHAIGKILIRPA
ncbi:zinc-binding dehydrogenase [Egibacter rhizosphaerae]|uniref:zinc-binding dehydrogenase n=1 Tax=Egibacter rhizosphaerae TaxID=1670831 RepID=UPI00197ABFB3|nr:zinc-binding dehydrogenase [Egibacter rhizosphaerae]